MSRQSSVRIGALTLRITAAQKRGGAFYDRLFDACDRFLPGCRCDVVLLPERSAIRDGDWQTPSGPIARRFADLARRHRLYLIAPLGEQARRRRYNTQLVFDPDGRVVHSYRKVHLAPGEDKSAEPGRRFAAFDLPWFRAGLMICFDAHFPEPARCLAVLGARVIFWPAYGDVRRLDRAAVRCQDSHVYLVGSGIVDMSCGLPGSAFTRGLVMGPDGKVRAEAPPRDGLLVADLPLDKAGRLPPCPADPNYLPRRQPASYRALLARPGPR